MVIVLRFVSVILISLLVLGTGLWSLRTGFIYLFDTAPARIADMPRTREMHLPAYDKDPALTVWVTEPLPGEPVILYFMGNAGTLSVHEPRLRAMADAGMGIAAMAYRGGGGQPGVPSEATLFHDATRLYAGLNSLFDRPIRDTERVIYGFGLGTGIATRLAVEQEELAVILEAPYTELCAAISGLARLVPGCGLLANDVYDSISRINKISAPLLILHGTEDDTVDLSEGQKMYDAALEPKFIRIYQGGEHENLARYGAVDDALSFIRVLRGAR